MSKAIPEGTVRLAIRDAARRGDAGEARPVGSSHDYDAIIVGGGPAGLSAALVLGRCRRSVLVIDAGRPRNYAALRMHNYLSRDGIEPRRFLDLARRDLKPYDVRLLRGQVTSAGCVAGGFAVRVRGHKRVTSRMLLLATGVVDELPKVTSVSHFYGQGVHHCPYCDGWEYRNRPLGAYGLGNAGLGLAVNLLTWSRDITVISDGQPPGRSGLRDADRLGINVRIEKVDRLLSRRGKPSPSRGDPLGRVVFENGDELRLDALFFNTDQTQRSGLPARLGCRMNADGGVIHDKRQRTGVEGLYLAGDASVDVQFVIVAAAEGAKAGMAMNHDLQERERRLTTTKR